MKIGIVGAGMIGGTLARRLAALGHQVSVANSRGPETLQELAQAINITAVPILQVVEGRDLVIISIPEKSVLQLPKGLFSNVPSEVPVIDTGNYYPRERDGRIEAIEGGMTESRWVSQQIGRPVTKVFNSIMFRQLMDGGRPKGTHGRIALPVAGDDAAAKAKVMELVEALGFNPLDSGSLDESWRQQPGTPCYLTDGDAAKLKAYLAAAAQQRTAKFTGTDKSPGNFANPQ